MVSLQIDSQSTGHFLGQYMNVLSHDIIHNRANRKTQTQALRNFISQVKLQPYGQTYLRSSMAFLISDLCGDDVDVERLKTWAVNDWDDYRTELVHAYKCLIRKDAGYFFIPMVEQQDERLQKNDLKLQKSQLRFKNPEVDEKVHKIVSKDMRDVFLRLEVQKALSILRAVLDPTPIAVGSSDPTQNPGEYGQRDEVAQNYIACIQKTLAFEKHPLVKEALLSLVNHEEEASSLKEPSKVLECIKDNPILRSHTLEELCFSVEVMLRGWDKFLLPLPNYDSNLEMDQKCDESDSYILQQVVESGDGIDDLEEELDQENSSVSNRLEVQEEDDLQQKQGVEDSRKKQVASPRKLPSSAQRSEDEASFTTAQDIQDEKFGTQELNFPKKNIIQDLVSKRKILHVNAKDPLESIVEIAETAKEARLMSIGNNAIENVQLKVEESDSQDETSQYSKVVKKKRKTLKTPRSTAKRRILHTSDDDDDDIWTDSEERKISSGPRHKWTEEECKAVKDGYEMYGRNWAIIKQNFSKALRRRTNVQIKDKFRNMLRAGEIVE